MSAALKFKWCRYCETAQPLREFHKRPTTLDGREYRCRSCEAARGREKRYQLSKRDFERLLHDQNHQCAICETHLHRPYVDHDHETGEVRGLLCNRCNIGLHYFENGLRAKALDYLESRASCLR